MIFNSAYTVDANENGVVLRFGKYVKTTEPGLRFKWPLGIDQVYKIQVTRQYKEEFGFRTKRSSTRTQYSRKCHWREFGNSSGLACSRGHGKYRY